MWEWLLGRRPSPDRSPGHPPVDGESTSSGSPDGASSDALDETTDEELLERVARAIVLRRMGMPAILFLESSKPLSFIGSQFMVFMEPFVKTFFTVRSYERFAEMMEDRDNYERLITKIEAHEAARVREEKAGKAARTGGGGSRSRDEEGGT